MSDSDADDDNVIYETKSSVAQTQRKQLIGDGSTKSEDEVLNGPPDGRRLKKTIALCGAFIGLGLAVAVIGPTLQELQLHLQTDLPHISYIFTGRSIGYVVGSIIGGVAFGCLNPLFLMSVNLAMSGIGLLVMPHFQRLQPTMLTISFVGLANGALDTGANVIVLRLWGKKAAPFMQALHFSFAVGALVAPLLASPFIGGNLSFNSTEVGFNSTDVGLNSTEVGFNSTEIVLNSTEVGFNSTFNSTEIGFNSSVMTSAISGSPAVEESGGTEGKQKEAKSKNEDGDNDPTKTEQNRQRRSGMKSWRSRKILEDVEVKISTTTVTTTTTSAATTTSVFPNSTTPNATTPTHIIHRARFQAVYTIIGTYLIVMALVFFYFIYTSTSSIHFPPSGGIHSDSESGSTLPTNKKFTYYILGLLFVFYFLYVGAEVGYGGYIYTFAISVDLPPKNAAHLNSLFWGSFAIMRGVSIFIASMISPLTMLVVDMLGCIMASLALVYDAGTSVTVLWVGTAILGASMASLFPAGISWLESHAPVTGKRASLLIVGSAVGEMVIPIILGHLFVLPSVGPMSLMYVMFVISIITALIFGYALYLATSEGKDFEGPLPEETMPALQILQGVQEEIQLPTISLGKMPNINLPKIPNINLGSDPVQATKSVPMKKSHKE